ncbi:MAG: NnrS family protein, partial [Gammaproteobacteria bacterium]
SAFIPLHAFAVGGIGVMTLGMMSRVALGHTGRNVFAPPPLLGVSFVLLLAAGIARVLLPLLAPGQYLLWVGLSQTLWVLAFALFMVVFLPILWRPRVDGRFG